MSSKAALALLALPLLVGACAPLNEQIGQRDPGFGEAVRYNAAIQTINPDPVYAEGGAQPGDNGERGVTAVERYRRGAVKQVEAEGTTSGSSGGGASSQ